VPIDAGEIRTSSRAWPAVQRDDDGVPRHAAEHRFDIEIEEDLIEEVARIYGFEKIPARRRSRRARCARPTRGRARATTCAMRWPRATTTRRSTSASSKRVGARFRRQRQSDPLLNPIASQLAVMRTTLIGSLLDGAAPQPEPPRRACACSRWAACSTDPSAKAGG
jgi:phenylalanyl-tRNA synthetase beta chain